MWSRCGGGSREKGQGLWVKQGMSMEKALLMAMCHCEWGRRRAAKGLSQHRAPRSVIGETLIPVGGMSCVWRDMHPSRAGGAMAHQGQPELGRLTCLSGWRVSSSAGVIVLQRSCCGLRRRE